MHGQAAPTPTPTADGRTLQTSTVLTTHATHHTAGVIFFFVVVILVIAITVRTVISRRRERIHEPDVETPDVGGPG
jgi:hypothetical protein